jgi:hypothetical protein
MCRAARAHLQGAVHNGSRHTASVGRQFGVARVQCNRFYKCTYKVKSQTVPAQLFTTNRLAI